MNPRPNWIKAKSDEKFHGGNLDWAEATFGYQQHGWIDLSTGICPWSYPFKSLDKESWRRLPTCGDLEALKIAAARRYTIADQDTLIAAPGSQSIIQLLPRLRVQSNVAVVSPTYSEHFAAWRKVGHSVIEIKHEDEINESISVVIITNPNNPDGRIVSRARLKSLRARLAKRDGWLIVDEAFADVAPDASISDMGGQHGLIILRSFGKFYGLAGLRLGFCIAPQPLSSLIAEALGPWPVSGPAVVIGCEALGDNEWRNNNLARLILHSKRLDKILVGAGLKIQGGTPLFRYAVGIDVQFIFDKLGRAGIYTRCFPEQINKLRFGIPRDEAQFERISIALASS